MNNKSERSLKERLLDPDDCPILVSPLAGWTDMPFRDILRYCGAKHLFVPFISAYALERDDVKERYQEEVSAEPGPVQIFGNDAEVCANAAKMLEDAGAELIDFNCGCSVKKIHRGGGGSALLCDFRNLKKILAEIKNAVSIPVTFKTRIGFDKDDDSSGLEACKIAQDLGYEWVTLHGRTAKQAFGGVANWEAIARLVDLLDIPVVGNGDVLTADDAKKMLEDTKCAGIMVGRGVMGDPWLAGDIEAFLSTGNRHGERSRPEIIGVMLRHQESLIDHYGPEKGTKDFRKHIGRYLRGFAQAARIRSMLVIIDDSAIVRDILTELGEGRNPEQVLEKYEPDNQSRIMQ
ncbi:MAG TPA: tRNA-dihydrouridine synthase [bacterium]